MEKFVITHIREVLQHIKCTDPKVSPAGIKLKTSRKWKSKAVPQCTGRIDDHWTSGNGVIPQALL